MRYLVFSLAVLACLAYAVSSAQAQSRIKDITEFEGIRDNMLIGYGLVVGLNGTGDSLNRSIFTRESVVGMLERMGVNARQDNLRTDNVAAVMVTATLPPFAVQGSRIDVTISTIGDASSLLGGTLVVTPLRGADGEVYALAQGPIAVGGFAAKGKAESIVKGVPTSGRIANGAIVEREIGFDLSALKTFRLSLRNPDLTTARRIAAAINKDFGSDVARSTDPGTVVVQSSGAFSDDPISMMTRIEQLSVLPDTPARVVIDEQTGIIVIGENVRINTVAIAQGSLTIRITETPQISQPGPFAQVGTTEEVDRTNIEATEETNVQLGVLRGGVNLQELVSGLNALGVTPRDLISILQSIKAAGALQADIEVM